MFFSAQVGSGDKDVMARYRKVEIKTWSDDKFRELTPVPPCGQGLWLWFLTGTRTTNIPGVVIGTGRVMAAELNWPEKAFREAFQEAFDKGMAKGDLEAGLVWLPNASRPRDGRNRPESPNVVRSWRDTWDEVPECSLKLEVWQQLKAFTEAFGEGFLKAFLEACRKPCAKASPNQEQEQEQEEEPPYPPEGGVGNRSRPTTENPRDGNKTEPPPEGLDPVAWGRWVEYRRSIRRPVKPASVPSAQRKLAAFGDDQDEAVEQSIANGWTGLFPVKDRAQGGGRGFQP